MKIIINSLNYYPELTGIGKYNEELCSELVKRGAIVEAIVAPPYYPEWRVHNGYSNYWYTKSEVKGVTLLRCPLFVPKNVTNFKRILHLFSFSFTSGFALLMQIFKKPDLILLIQPTLLCAPIVLIVGKLTGAKTVMHIQDFEIDAMLGLRKTENKESRVLGFIRKIESWLLMKFDMVSSISDSMLDRVLDKGVPKAKLNKFPNWADLDFVNPETVGDSLKAEWGFPKSTKIVLYSGNIGKKQGLELILEASKHFVNQKDVQFVFVGNGNNLDNLKEVVRSQRLYNVHFLPLQAWQRVPEMLSLADIHLVIQKKGVADTVLPSKLTNILAAGGHAIVTAEPDTELGKLANTEVGIYELIKPECVTSLIESLSLLLTKDTQIPNIIARKYAEENLSKNKIIQSFFTKLEAMIEY